MNEALVALWVLAVVAVILVGYSRSLLQAKRVLAFVVNGDVIHARKAKLTEEGVEVDGKVYPAPRDAFKIIRWKGKAALAVFVDATANAVYRWDQSRLQREAPPELLSKLALKRILRQLTRREVQILPFVTGLTLGILILLGGLAAIYQQVVVPAESKAAAAEQVLNDYQQLKVKYDSLVRENERLQQQVEELQAQIQELQAILAQYNATIAGNGTIVTPGPNGTVVVGGG